MDRESSFDHPLWPIRVQLIGEYGSLYVGGLVGVGVEGWRVEGDCVTVTGYQGRKI